MELQINEEYKNFIRPLQKEELEALEENLKKNGCREPITILEDNTIIEGHNRYNICRKHNIEYSTFVQKSLDTEADIKLWMLYNQIGKRNYTKFDRSMFAIRIEELEKVKAKERQGNRNDLEEDNIRQTLALSCEGGKSLEIAAKRAGVSYETVRKTKKILEAKTDGEIIKKLEKDEITVNAAYKHVKQPEKEQQKDSDVKAQENKAEETKITLKHLSPENIDDQLECFKKTYLDNNSMRFMTVYEKNAETGEIIGSVFSNKNSFLLFTKHEKKVQECFSKLQEVIANNIM